MTTVLATNAYKAACEVKLTKLAPLPVLNYARLHTVDGWLVITTAELTDEGIKAKSARIPARIDDEIDTCVPMYKRTEWEEYESGRGKVKHTLTTHPFIDWLAVTQVKGKNAPDQIALTFDPTREVLHIQAGNARAEFKCMSASKFPSVAI